jgi:peptidyl-prolyl cis-trans isomerase C
MKSVVTAALFLAAMVCIVPARAEPNTVVAKVNGIEITEGELQFAEAEVDLTNVPPKERRRALVEHLAQTHLMADAAEKTNLGTGPGFEARMKYYKLRALREIYIEKNVRNSVTTEAAKAHYDERVKSISVQQEIRARHILVKTEEEAQKIAKEIEGGADFAEMAKKYSQDDAGEGGGDLGYFSPGQMLKEFETAAFATPVGKVSAPVQTKHGWHLIKVEDKRNRKLPSFDEVKDQIIASLTQAKLQKTVLDMFNSAKIEYIDPEIKKAVDEEAAAAAEAQKAAAAEAAKKNETEKKEPEKKDSKSK